MAWSGRRDDDRPVLIIMHQEHSTYGHIGTRLMARGINLDVRRPRFGEALPRTLSGHAGTVMFGGPMSANDDDAYIHQERRLIALALTEERPFLGVCLGGQLLALELGAKVWPDEQGRVEIGYHAVEPLPEAVQLGGEWPQCFYQWHREGFDLPAGALQLVRSNGAFANQAFCHGRAAIGLQFHPEITFAMVSRWSRNDAKLEQPGAWSRSRQLADHLVHAPIVQRWLDKFLLDWLSLNDSDKPPHDSLVCKSATVQV